MQIRSVDIGSTQVAIIEIDRDLLGGPESQEVRKAVQELAAKGNRMLVLDFSGAAHINSMGLGVLTSAYVTYAKLGGRIVLCNCGPNVRALLGLTRVGSLFTLHGSREEAITSLSR